MSETRNPGARRKELKAALSADRGAAKTAGPAGQECIRDGKADIRVRVEDLYNPLSVSGSRRLNSDLFDFVEESANLLPSLVPIRVVLHGVDAEDREKVSDLFRMHYRAAAQEQIREQRMNRLKMICMTAVGIVFILAYLFFGQRQEDSLFLEVLSVIGSFSLWEAVNCFLVECRSIQRALYKTAQFLTAEVAFAEE